MKLYLAPINTLSNHPFRRLCLELGADYVFTEMIWAERILGEDEYETRKIMIEDDAKTIIQIIAEKHENIEPFIRLLRKKSENIKEINFNMGCPQSTLSKKMLGGGILKDKEKMKKFCEEFQKACHKYGYIPSIKTRTGINTPALEEYVKIIKDAGITKIYIHARTLTQGYIKKADYKPLANIKGIEIIVNGDITDHESYLNAINSAKCTGAMIGREALRDPSVFLKIKKQKHPPKKEVMQRFLDYANDLPLDITKKNISWMTQGMVKGSLIRHKINNAKNLEEIKKIIQENN